MKRGMRNSRHFTAEGAVRLSEVTSYLSRSCSVGTENLNGLLMLLTRNIFSVPCHLGIPAAQRPGLTANFSLCSQTCIGLQHYTILGAMEAEACVFPVNDGEKGQDGEQFQEVSIGRLALGTSIR
jgi:hypothetical protein